MNWLCQSELSQVVETLTSPRNRKKLSTGNIEEAESSLRESGYLNNEEARAVLGRLEYQKGNIEGALHVFEGISASSVTSKIKVAISRRVENSRQSRSDTYSSISMQGVNLLLEAIFLKAKSLQKLGRFKEAAESCKIIFDTVQSTFHEGLPPNSIDDSKLQQLISKAAKLLPDLWKHAGFFQEAILSYRRILLFPWNIKPNVTSKIQKEFAIFLLYGGCEAYPPSFNSPKGDSFVPNGNIEEAILLLIILLRKFSLKVIEWDPTIIDHLTFALSISGKLDSLAHQIEEFLPGVLHRTDRYYTLALCYFKEDDNIASLNLLRKLLSNREDPKCIKGLLLASKICGKDIKYVEEGIDFSQKAVSNCTDGCNQIKAAATCLLGISLSSKSRYSVSDSERSKKQSEALEALEKANKITGKRDINVLFYLCLENASQRKLDVALSYAKELLKMKAGSDINDWILLSRILSAKKQFSAAENVINAGLEQSGTWDQSYLLTTKAKIQIAQGGLNQAIKTYTRVLAILRLQDKSLQHKKNHLEGRRVCRSLEIDAWNDLTHLYIMLSRWKDAEACLSKIEAINPFCVSRWYCTGMLYEARGYYKDALKAYTNALDVDPNHVPSLVSAAAALRKQGDVSLVVAKGYLRDALRLDNTNHYAWFNLGLIYKVEDGSALSEASRCFQAAAYFEETAPVESFR